MKKINIHFFNMLNIAIIACLIDILIYATNISYKIALPTISILILLIDSILIKKKKIKLISNFEILDFIFIGIVITIAILKISIPDFSYDVSNYHIYLQENIKIDKINFDFFAGKIINGFQFPLGDRMHYIFRYILGYRLGTILSYYSVIIIFYQTKNILNILCPKSQINSIGSILCISSYIIWQWTGTYYIDNFSIIFILEIIHIFIKQENILKDKKTIYYISFISGIATAIKITNIILIIPIIMLLLIKERKNISSKLILQFCISILIFIIPSITYIIDNIIQTGSPLFPYYNNIFKSEYFGLFEWKDSRFGIKNTFYKCIWPIYVSILTKGYGDDWQINDPIWGIGYIVLIFYIIYAIVRKQKNKLNLVAIISLTLTIIWILLLEGYMRYALIIPVLYSILIISILINKVIVIEITKKIKNIIVITIMSILVIIIAINLNVNKKISENYSLIFNDKKSEKIHINGVWGVIGDDSALTQLVREKDIPIYNLEKNYISTSDIVLKKYNENITNKDIYILATTNKNYIKIRKLYECGYEVQLIKIYNYKKIPYLEKNDIAYLYKIKHLE